MGPRRGTPSQGLPAASASHSPSKTGVNALKVRDAAADFARWGLPKR
jgi:hypothetical protein